MTAGDLPGLMPFSRPIKPVALGMSLLMLTLVVVNLTNVGELKDTALGDAIAVMAGAAAVCLWAGWLARSQRMAEAGLLLAAVTYVTRSAFILLDLGPGNMGVWLGAGAAVIAGGAFLLESWEDRRVG